MFWFKKLKKMNFFDDVMVLNLIIKVREVIVFGLVMFFFLVIVVLLIGIVGNIFVIIVVRKKRYFYIKMNLLFVNLVVFDLMVNVLVYIVGVV